MTKTECSSINLMRGTSGRWRAQTTELRTKGCLAASSALLESASLSSAWSCSDLAKTVNELSKWQNMHKQSTIGVQKQLGFQIYRLRFSTQINHLSLYLKLKLKTTQNLSFSLHWDMTCQAIDPVCTKALTDTTHCCSALTKLTFKEIDVSRLLTHQK